MDVQTPAMRLLHSRNATPAILSAKALEAATKVSSAALHETVCEFSKPRHFQYQAAENRASGERIAQRLSAFECDIEFQGDYRNVVALPRNVRGPLTLVCSHYDTVPGTPGADDNGSAIAAMLECARVLKGMGAPVGFVCFNCEEDGLLGSEDFVKRWVASNPRRIASVHVLEMIGFCSHAPGSQKLPVGLPIQLPDQGDFLGLLANRDSALLLDCAMTATRAAVPHLPRVGMEAPDGTEQFFPVLLRSDHAPFWRARIPALMWTDTAEYRNPHYHEPSDQPDTLDYHFLAQVTSGLVASVLAVSESLDPRPGSDQN